MNGLMKIAVNGIISLEVTSIVGSLSKKLLPTLKPVASAGVSLLTYIISGTVTEKVCDYLIETEFNDEETEEG